jgi:hypothetical protein
MVAILSLALATCLFQWAADVVIARRKARRGEVDVAVERRHKRLDDDGASEKSDTKGVAIA